MMKISWWTNATVIGDETEDEGFIYLSGGNSFVCGVLWRSSTHRHVLMNLLA